MKTLKICRSISVKGGREYPFEVTHTIEYHAAKRCGEESEGSRTRFKSTRNYIVYDSGEEVVRYAMTSKVIPLTGSGEDGTGMLRNRAFGDVIFSHCSCSLRSQDKYELTPSQVQSKMFNP